MYRILYWRSCIYLNLGLTLINYNFVLKKSCTIAVGCCNRNCTVCNRAASLASCQAKSYLARPPGQAKSGYQTRPDQAEKVTFWQLWSVSQFWSPELFFIYSLYFLTFAFKFHFSFPVSSIVYMWRQANDALSVYSTWK